MISESMVYEYKEISVDVRDRVQTLNEYGARGWRLKIAEKGLIGNWMIVLEREREREVSGSSKTVKLKNGTRR